MLNLMAVGFERLSASAYTLAYRCEAIRAVLPYWHKPGRVCSWAMGASTTYTRAGMEIIYRQIAKVLAIPFVCDALVAYSQKKPYRNIYGKGGSLYMIRGWIFNSYENERGERPKRSWLMEQLPSMRVHIILRPDTDRHMHDHPWDARTFIMKRYYVEKRQRQDKDYEGLDYYTRRAGQTVTLKYGEYHAITEVPHAGVVTLFVTWKYQGVWGFLVDGIKVPFMEYLKGKTNAVR